MYNMAILMSARMLSYPMKNTLVMSLQNCNSLKIFYVLKYRSYLVMTSVCTKNESKTMRQNWALVSGGMP